MTGDGVSLPTSIAQLGNAAKTQAKGQQNQTTATPFSEQLDKDEKLKIQRVQQTEKSEQDGVDPEGKQRRDDKRKKRRRARRLRRTRVRDQANQDNAEFTDDKEQELEPATVGSMIDKRA